MSSHDRRRVETGTLELRRVQITDEDIGRREKPVQRVQTGWVSQIESNASLATVDRVEPRRAARNERRAPGTCVVSARALDLQHGSARSARYMLAVGPA